MHVYGDAIVPSSTYEVQLSTETCADLFADPLVVTTSRWGDVVTPFNPPSMSSQPDFGDIAALVDKFKGSAGAPSKVRSQLQANTPDPSLPVSFADIAAGVDAFRGTPYPFDGPSECP